MLDIKYFQEKIRHFASEREWQRFHTPKNIATALTVESAELLELFQWLDNDEAQQIMATAKGDSVRHEVADVAVYLLRLCDLLKIDLPAAIDQKMALNAAKYPIEKSKGHARKYDDL
jgi:dCTP diphosphatase